MTKTYLYEVLAKGLPVFRTDNQREALEDARWKSEISSYVTVIDIYDRVVISYQDHQVHIPFYGIKQLDD